MASDIFAKIGDIKGESLDDKHKDEIDVLSFSWGLAQTGGAAATGGAGAGKVQFQDFHFTKRMDKSSPILFLKCATGEHINEGTITARRAGQRTQEYLIIKMNDILITSYQTGGSSEDNTPTDQVSMNFAKVVYSYIPQKADGQSDEAVTVAYDIKGNKEG